MSSTDLVWAVCLAAASCSVQGATISWDFRTGSSTAAESFGAELGNSLRFTTDGVSVTATAWSVTILGSTFVQSEVGRHSTGLGVCNFLEGMGCGDPTYFVDNFSEQDFILFQFSRPVVPVSMVIDPVDLYDRDVSYAAASRSGSVDLRNLSIGDLAAAGVRGRNSTAAVSDKPRVVNFNASGPVTALLVGAKAGDFDDRFTIRQLTAEAPEPATLGLAGLALGAIGMLRRGHARKSRAISKRL